MTQEIRDLQSYFIAVIQLFAFFRVFNFILYKLIGNKIGYNREKEWRRNLLMDLYFSLIYFAALMTSKSIWISLFSAFLGSELVVGIGEGIYKREKKDV